MEFKIVIYRPGFVWTITIKAFEALIVGELSIYARTSVDTIQKTRCEVYWCSTSAMENDIKMYLEQIITGNEIIETRTKCPRHTSERDLRIQEFLSQILGFSDR